jgi:thiol-disulfide isomerase/thioredoxin
MPANSAGVPQKALWIVALSALAGFAAVYVIGSRSDNAPRTETSAPSADNATAVPGKETGKMAAFVRKATPEPLPDITFKGASGNDVLLSSLKGKTILLNLWATWCQPCREEMPTLSRLQQALGGDKFEVVELSLDRKGYEASRKFLQDVNAGGLTLYCDPTAKQGMALKLVGMPTTILINKEGLEVGRLLGPAEWDSDEAKQLIKAAMN